MIHDICSAKGNMRMCMTIYDVFHGKCRVEHCLLNLYYTKTSAWAVTGISQVKILFKGVINKRSQPKNTNKMTILPCF